MLVAIGFVEETADHRYTNSAVLLRGGAVIGLHRKVYLPTYGMFDEGRFTRAGDRVRTTEVGEPLGRIGLSICEDFWHPSVPMIQSQDGASLLVNLAAGPARAPGSDAGLAAIAGWHKMQETYALLGTVAVAFCNRVGNEEGLTFWGGSRLIGANGAVIAEAPLYEEALVVGSLETDDLRMQRYQLPILADERLELTRRELDRIIAERADLPAPDEPEDGSRSRERGSAVESAPLPQVDVAQVVEVIVAFIRGQLEQTGFERLVVGVSGGVDSAATAALAVRAAGPENVLAVLMPFRDSDPASETDARLLVEGLGCDMQRVDITPMAEPMLTLIGDGDEPAIRVRRGNVLARLRMIVLYDRSAAFDGLVCGTSNKTEALLGYGTLHGDMAAAIQPIGDLYKSQLRAVAGELGVPAQIIAKPPSADLWPGQTDEGELGATYDDLDRILYALVDRRWTVDRCVRAGLDRSLVEWTATRVARYEFKRQAPPVAKVSLRTPGIDHLYPRRRPGSRRA